MVRRKAVLASEYFLRTIYATELSERLYTAEKRERHFETRSFIENPTRAGEIICSNCNKEFSRRLIFFRAKRYCHYCHNYVCRDCISTKKALIPQYLYYKQDWCQHSVCQKAHAFLCSNDILKFSSREIELISKKLLHKFAKEQKKINRLYDLIKCSEWERLVVEQDSPLSDNKNLVLQECYLSTE